MPSHLNLSRSCLPCSSVSRPRADSLPRLRPLSWLVASLLCSPTFAQAQAAASPPPDTLLAQARAPLLGTVIVSGSRSEQEAADLPASSEVLDRATLEAEQIHDIRDAVRDMPNVSVKRAPARFGLAASNTGRDGNAGFNICGLEGNRVLMLVDGIRTPRSYVFSANAFGRDYFDIGLAERIEIIKGPASALYGSDGLAGLVNIITRTPESFLREGERVGGSVSLSYGGDDNGWKTGATLAGKAGDTVHWLLAGTVARAHALENMGANQAANSNRTAPNPEQGRSNALLGKLILMPDAAQRHTITLEHVDKSNRYELLSGRAAPPLAATSVIDQDAKTVLGRDRLSWDGRIQVRSALADNLQAIVSYQRADSREYIFENRNTAADRSRDVTYDEDSWQLGLQADKTVRMAGGWAQKLRYGIDHTRTDVQNLQTGLAPPMGETFPLKRFPDTRETTTALYLQDEFLFDQWSITPGVRYDRYKLDASQAGFNAVAASLSDSAVSPKLGVLFRATPQWNVYGNYASGFKAPNAFQVNNFFENVIGGYRTIPNPNLRPERSRNVEIGLRGGTGFFTLDVAAFTGRYKDLIVDNALVGGTGIPGIDPLIYQTINVGRARISGFEIKGMLDWRTGGRGFSLPFSYGQTRGRDSSTGLALNSVDPSKLTVGVRYQAPTWSLGLTAIHHAAKSGSDIDNADVINATRPANPAARQFATPSATTLDLEGQWHIRKDLRLNAAIVNLTDRKYWMWADVRGLASTSALLDAYTQPGRHLNVSLVLDF